jgi:glycosyltransferase involved in cell wall biosynthesis
VATLVILTPAELTRDPRARRQVAAARELGFDVVGVTGQVSGEGPLPLDGVRVLRVGPQGRVDAPGLAAGGAAGRLRELRGLYRLLRLGVRTLRLVRGARHIRAADVVHANDLDTLPAASFVARRLGARLVYDAHELYADFDPDPSRFYRRALLSLERRLAQRADAVVTVSDALADELQRRHGLRELPLVVLNAPELDETEPTTHDGPLRAVYTGALGTGRPLGDILDAIGPDVRLALHVVQVPPELIRREVERRGLADRVEVAAPVPPEALPALLRKHDVGIVFDRPVTRNAELSLPNKLFEYLMAGLAVVVPRLDGMGPLVEREEVGLAYGPGEPSQLAAALERLATDPDELASYRTRARRAAVSTYNAEAQRPALARAWDRSRDDDHF